MKHAWWGIILGTLAVLIVVGVIVGLYVPIPVGTRYYVDCGPGHSHYSLLRGESRQFESLSKSYNEAQGNSIILCTSAQPYPAHLYLF